MTYGNLFILFLESRQIFDLKKSTYNSTFYVDHSMRQEDIFPLRVSASNNA